MGKRILAWIETHWIATAVITMAIVGAIVITPILTNRWILDNKVKKNLGYLSIQEGSEKTTEKEQFDIVSEQGEYKIVPKYNKPVKNWTKSEKQEYLKKVEELEDKDKIPAEMQNFIQQPLNQIQ